MLQAAIAGDPRFALDGCELERPGPSFAIDTVEIIRQQFAAAALFYLIGEDNVAKLDTWQRIDDLRNLVTFVVFDRGQARVPHEMPKLSRRLDMRKRAQIVDQLPQLRRGLNIPSEKNVTSRLDAPKDFCGGGIQLRSWNSGENQLARAHKIESPESRVESRESKAEP
jgi:hypothetical protein